MMKIGQLAKITGCSIQTIRFYEREKLLPTPHRSEGNYRAYSQSALHLLLFIKQCRSIDLSLGEIRTLLALKNTPDASCEDINNIIDAHLNQVNARIKELNTLKHQLKDLQQTCTDNLTVENCGILHNLS
jgi:Cd(II)/Pb(II)-responsive transcriptional regulator